MAWNTVRCERVTQITVITVVICGACNTSCKENPLYLTRTILDGIKVGSAKKFSFQKSMEPWDCISFGLRISNKESLRWLVN